MHTIFHMPTSLCPMGCDGNGEMWRFRSWLLSLRSYDENFVYIMTWQRAHAYSSVYSTTDMLSDECACASVSAAVCCKGMLCSCRLVVCGAWFTIIFSWMVYIFNQIIGIYRFQWQIVYVWKWVCRLVEWVDANSIGHICYEHSK